MTSKRLILSTGLFCAWFLLLMSGVAFAGSVHLLLLGSLFAVPWRQGANRS